MSSDHTIPDGKWEFNNEVTKVFDDMLSRSIPQYEVMRASCLSIARRFVVSGTDIVDLGCSRGEAMAPLIKEFGASNRFVGVEISDPMASVCEARFSGYISTGVVSIERTDLRASFPACRASVILCVLTAQFVPIEHRARLIQKIYAHLVPGGALILVEKVLGSSSVSDDLLVSEYLELKAQNGYSQEEIDRKKLSLEGVLVPLTSEGNEIMLKKEGFSQVECFWRWMNFSGWVAIKTKGSA